MTPSFTLLGIIAGALTGLLVTILVTTLWPRGRLRWVRPIIAPLLGAGIALLVMYLIK
jgi:fructose-specific phosphotransferase system IIC component